MIYDFPIDLPQSADDGACNHLVGKTMPKIKLPSTSGRESDLGALAPGRTVIYCYPRTGKSGEQKIQSDWHSLYAGLFNAITQKFLFR